jgi:hypothetical protein
MAETHDDDKPTRPVSADELQQMKQNKKARPPEQTDLAESTGDEQKASSADTSTAATPWFAPFGWMVRRLRRKQLG